MKKFNTQVEQLKESIFSTITQLANANSAINLAQGFPDFEGPQWVLELAQKSLMQGKNQYAPSFGILPLREAIAGNYKKYYGLEYDPTNEVLVTNGATEAIYASISALINPGDEVVAFEPLYDSYLAAVQIAGGKLKAVTLKAPKFQFSIEDLKNTVSDNTKLLILNNPHNPTGRVFTREELNVVAELAQKHDFYVMSDEVYEFLTFDQDHIPLATLPNMKNRVLTISSIGKTLSLTGWKIGWVCSSPEITKAIHNVHQFMSFCVAHPLQAAVAEAWSRLDEYLPEFRQSYEKKREVLTKGLKELGYNVVVPQGTYFALVQTPENSTDVEFCKNLITSKKVAAIPTSAFYIQSDEGQRWIRFCFAKKEETLVKALQSLGGKT